MKANEAVLASSILAVAQSRIRELADIAMSMDGVLRLYFGESNQPTPQFIKDAAVRNCNSTYHERSDGETWVNGCLQSDCW